MGGVIEDKNSHMKSNFTRNRSDFFVMLVILAAVWYFMKHMNIFQRYSSVEDREGFMDIYDIFKLKNCTKSETPGDIQVCHNEWIVWLEWLVISSLAMHGITWSMFWVFRATKPEVTPLTHLSDQRKAIVVNFFLLPCMQIAADYLQYRGYTKATMGNTQLWEIVRDSCLWMLSFEWAWYFQHRLMHDNKFLWNLGHSYHHSWKRPEHMIGVTNFAFDHIVEIWVTMSSSFLGYLLFPSNFYVGKAISFFYMVLAVLAHWEGWHGSRYHINHHYLITKNYGSHIPIFDILFGTYQWDPYTHPDMLKNQDETDVGVPIDKKKNSSSSTNDNFSVVINRKVNSASKSPAKKTATAATTTAAAAAGKSPARNRSPAKKAGKK